GAGGKYGAGLGAIIPRLTPERAAPSAPPRLGSDLEADLREAAAREEPTPQRVFLRRTAATAFAVAAREPPAGAATLRHAYSLKTCFDHELLDLARRAGMLAECISLLEVRRALEAGWSTDAVVLNGPGKWWPASEPRVDGLRAVFCDSVE